MRTADVIYLSVHPDHLTTGTKIPDGDGHYTLHQSVWAYCSAARAQEQHSWAFAGGVPVSALDHDNLLGLVRIGGR